MSRWIAALAASLAVLACAAPTPSPLPPTTPGAGPTASPTQSVSSTASAAPSATVAGQSTPIPPSGTPRPTLEPRPTPDEGAYAPLVVDDFGFTAIPVDAGNYASFGAVLTNPNSEWAVYRMPVQVSLFDANDAFVGGAEVFVTALPGQITAISGQTFGAGDAVRMLVEVPEDPTPYVPFAPSGSVDVSDIQVDVDETRTLVTGTLTSSLASDQQLLQVYAVYRAADDTIVGGAPGAVPAIESGSSVAFEINDSPSLANVARAEVYWQLGGQLP